MACEQPLFKMRQRETLCCLSQGNWRGISRQYVTSRTPTQVASHAQKYSLRTSGSTKRRSRFSALEEQQAQQVGMQRSLVGIVLLSDLLQHFLMLIFHSMT